MHFAGVDDRPAAEALRGIVLHVAADRAPALDDPDEYYDTDLVGLAAREPDGTELGPVVDVVHAAGATYLVLGSPGGSGWCRSSRPSSRASTSRPARCAIDPPEGLFDL